MTELLIVGLICLVVTSSLFGIYLIIRGIGSLIRGRSGIPDCVVGLVLLCIGGLPIVPFVSRFGCPRGIGEETIVRNLALAWKCYYIDYGVFPGCYGNNDQVGDIDVRMVEILNGSNTTHNKREITYYTFTTNDLANGFLRDRWKNPYHFILDMNYDGKVLTPWGEEVKKVAAVWSDGPDGRSATPQDANDNPCSWR